MGSIQYAIEDYSEAIALNSNDINYYHTRGDAYYNIKEYPKALHDFNAIIILNQRTQVCIEYLE